MGTEQKPAGLYSYRYEMHCHNNWCSACAHNSPEEMARAYYNAGYAGMVFTDHFLSGNTAVDKSLPWEEKVKRYYAAYMAARIWAEKQEREFHVLFGLEHVYTSGKEVLTYGIDLNFLLEHVNLHLYPLEKYAGFVHEAGGFLSHAHPFRHAPYINPNIKPQYKYMDGAEIFNFYNTGEENKEAALFAEKHGLLPTSGGDEHRISGASIGKAGVALKAPVDDGQALVAVLRSGDYRLIINGEIV